MPLGRFSLREVLSRPSRTILTFLSIAIGVAAVVAVLLSISTTHAAQRNVLRMMAGKADLEVVAESSEGFDVRLLKTIRETPGVDLAVPSMKRYAKLIRGEIDAAVQVLGIDPKIDQKVREYDISVGAPLKNAGDALLDASFAKSLQITVGDQIRLLAHGGLHRYRVVGLVAPRGATQVSWNNGVYLLLRDAISAFGSRLKIDQVHLIVSREAEVPAVRAALQVALPAGVTVQTPPTRNQMAEETMFATENGLYMAIAFTLLIAVFIIYNTFQMSVGERRKQLGILRTVGATRSQVGWMILREALLISAIAAVAGCLLGVYGAGWLTSATERLMQVHLPGVQLSWSPFLIAVGFGVGVAVSGAILPARRAGLVEPIEAIRDLELADNEKVKAFTRPLCIAAFGIGTTLTLMAVNGRLPLGGDVAGIVFLLLGIVLLIPSSLERVSGIAIRWIRPWLGVEAELAQRQLTRHLGRSALTIGVLFVAISFSTGMAGNMLDNIANVRDWCTRTIIGDFFIRATDPSLMIGGSPSMPDGIAQQLRQIPGIESLDSIRYLQVHSNDQTVMLIVRDFVGKPDHFFDLVEGTSEAAAAGLKAGNAVVGTVLARRLELHAGDTLPLEGPQGTETFKIVAVTNDYLAGGLTAYLQRDVAERRLGVTGVDALIVQADDDKLVDVEQRLQTLCQKNSIIMESFADVVRMVNRMVNSVIASLWMLMALGCLIAVMGLVNTLTMNILEQTREIGMLRVVAMTRRQVRRMILAEAALLGMIGLIPGSITGVFFSFLISLSSSRVLGHPIVFHVRPGLILGCLASGIVAVLIASLLPAERAARVKLASGAPL